MAKENAHQVHSCGCSICRLHPYGQVAREHRALNRLVASVDERARRLLVGFLARQQGHGGIAALARITGLDRNTIARGQRELRQRPRARGQRIRRQGAGRPRAETTVPGVVETLKELLRDATAGDPISGLKWTHRSLRKLRQALRRRGIELAPTTIARLLDGQGYSLRTNRKRLAGIRDPDRDEQFRYLTRLRRQYITLALPVISVDTKKKEWVGNFKNPGRCWRQRDRDVFDHDYPSWASGQAIPNGVYDLASKDGYVLVGTSHNTPAFMVAAIRRWWLDVGRRRYPEARRMLIEADGGGATDHRKWGWKVGLQRLADEFDLIITMTHYPAGASKWNPIEHEMFGPISANWAGEPLVSYEKILKFIRTTRTETVLHCRARLDKKDYPVEHRVAPEEKACVQLKRHRIRPQLNYTIYPHGHAENR